VTKGLGNHGLWASFLCCVVHARAVTLYWCYFTKYEERCFGLKKNQVILIQTRIFGVVSFVSEALVSVFPLGRILSKIIFTELPRLRCERAALRLFLLSLPMMRLLKVECAVPLTRCRAAFFLE